MVYNTTEEIKHFICGKHIAKQYQVSYSYSIYRTHMYEDKSMDEAVELCDSFWSATGFDSSDEALKAAKERISNSSFKDQAAWAIEIKEYSRLSERIILIETIEKE